MLPCSTTWHKWILLTVEKWQKKESDTLHIPTAETNTLKKILFFFLWKKKTGSCGYQTLFNYLI